MRSDGPTDRYRVEAHGPVPSAGILEIDNAPGDLAPAAPGWPEFPLP